MKVPEIRFKDTHPEEPVSLLPVKTVLADQELKCQGRSFSQGSEERLLALTILSRIILLSSAPLSNDADSVIITINHQLTDKKTYYLQSQSHQ